MSAVDVVLFDQCEAQATGETAKCQPPAPAGLSCDVWKPGLWQSPTILTKHRGLGHQSPVCCHEVVAASPV